MQISDIQKAMNPMTKGAVVTFADDEGYDFMQITISKNDLWQLHDFTSREFSNATQLREDKKLGIRK